VGENPNGTRKEEYGSKNIAIAGWIPIKQKKLISRMVCLQEYD